jgi:PucR C-terminal helix-turn-helix domain
MDGQRQPWHELSPEVATVLRPLLPELTDEIIEAVGTVPAYGRPLEGEFGVGVRAGVQQALTHLVAEIEASGPVPRSDVYRQLGRGEMRSGRSLDSLLSAYRIGARVTWRRAAAAGEAAGLEPATLYLLAESIFAYIDVLSAESAEGHALERTAIAGAVEQARRRLVRLLVREPPAPVESVREAALAADWELPRTVAALVIEGHRPARALALPVDAISEAIGELTCALIPDPDGPGRRAELQRSVSEAGITAGLGTTVSWPDAALSFARARAVLELVDDAAAGELVNARERAGELLLGGDRTLASEFAADRLAPLATLSPGSRERLRETLAAWLAEQGRLGPTASRLGIHPQTARYRLGRLRELFGTGLDDGDERFWLDLALRVGGERR